jgi:hypothetical protein
MDCCTLLGQISEERKEYYLIICFTFRLPEINGDGRNAKKYTKDVRHESTLEKISVILWLFVRKRKHYCHTFDIFSNICKSKKDKNTNKYIFYFMTLIL